MKLRWINILSIFILLMGLAGVRFFQYQLFYDPLEEYFHLDFHAMPLPEIDYLLLLFSYSLRFILNSILSLGVLWLLFRSSGYIRASLWVYLFAFIALVIMVIISLNFNSDFSKMVLFYSRRFLIHPLLLFILVAGGYLLKLKNIPVINDRRQN